ncbi:Uncharacterized protein TCAP_01205 [Tolypocladium capitatum]|uniref:Uncharacterized protein n=1 Tax=Tolypocladium capitatum TaxID=45235 RepID=A0A2K3QMW1_9HYPO|nr:Uncharacterized protein TCAP_01205 [Tolypocladium capitatum]
MDARPLLPQPDFGTISGNFDALSEQFALCANLPAVDGSARLMQRMDAVLEQLTLLNRKVDILDRKVDGLDRKVDGLGRNVSVLNRNAVVRTQNSTVVRGDVDLVPLYSVLTGDVIDGFPRNVDQLERLPAREVDQLLRHLGESAVGSAAEKKRNLKFALGLVTRAL